MGERELSDERILGTGKFVEKVTQSMDLMKKYRLTAAERKQKAIKTIEKICKEKGISIKALTGGSRLRNISRVRRDLTVELVNEYGLSYAETARQLGVSTSAIAKIFNRYYTK